ncbi:positive regulation of synapse structural plasticity [Desmophyllum pertusum]|uniref:Positive regulation of synapse structural plasticity n=1 Tax=Desmophyllum pertusum TaxID=174260 RepID=A0A9X0DD56_9CNID|nr:positive regulation of synapse structural plasticity [Desmophyllum pertusum]
MNVYTASTVQFVITIALLNTESKATIPDPKPGVAEKTPDQDADIPDDPYMNYLQWPHFHFSGTFISDTSTVNNDPFNYDTEKFVQADQLPNEVKGNPSYNPRGSGEWSVNGSVTHVCYANGHCVGDDEGNKDTEPLMAAPILEGGNMTAAKMVDLDTQAQLFSEIWGWRIQIGNLFSADFTPVPFKYIWAKMITTEGYEDSAYGAVYQSVLSNIRWIDNGKDSPFIKQLQTAMNNDNIDSERLSIRFNVDMFTADPKKSTFTMGRVTGTIGLLGRKSPPFFTRGRMMKPLNNDKLHNAPFYVDQKKGKLFVDFGNSLPIDENGSFDTKILGNLLVAVPLDTNPSLTCSDDLLWLGLIYNKFPNWYHNSAGVQVFPTLGSLSPDEIKTIGQNPLVVAEVTGTMPVLNCKKVVMAEARDGIDIHPYNKWTFRKNPGERANAQLIATKFGKPLAGARVNLGPCNCLSISFGGGPPIGQPPLPVPSHAITNEHGIATFDIEVKDPKNNRSYIDGQIYHFIYSLESQDINCENLCEKDALKLLNSLIVIKAWDHYTPKGNEPTWLDDIYPIFKQYANLYPVMTDNFVDLGNYYEVINYKLAIKRSMELPMSHPNHMPVVRDLSSSKRKVILKWLSKEKPLIGNPQSHYSVEHLRNDLQTALQLEHSTIPPYLTALASIKSSYNLEIQKVMKAIIIQEMMHMALVANILNAVGGKPSLYSKDFIPHYPSRLPGGVQPDLVVPIEKISLGLIRNIFMKIEQPVLELEHISSFQHTFSFIHRHKNMVETGHCQKNEEGTCSTELNTDTEPQIRFPVDGLVDEDPSPCRLTSFAGKQFGTDFQSSHLERVRQMLFEQDVQENDKQYHPIFPGDDTQTIVKHHNTIGAFYNHIMNALGNLTDCGRNNSIFTGDPNKQVDFHHWSVHGHSLKVYDYFTAVEAIQDIVEQVKVALRVTPLPGIQGRRRTFHITSCSTQVVEKHEIQVVETVSPPDNDDDSVVDFTKLCNGTYYFNGTKIPFDPKVFGRWFQSQHVKIHSGFKSL